MITRLGMRETDGGIRVMIDTHIRMGGQRMAIQKPGRLQGTVALITGAARGIGRATAALFVREGATVVLTDVRDLEGEEAARALGPSARYRHLDVRSERDWASAMADVLGTEQRFDVLVNNAGITGFEDGVGPHDPEHASLDDWRAVMATNLEGVFLGCRAAIGAMRSAGTGSIINMSSRSGVVGMPGAGAYAAIKAGVRNHTKTVALYCASQGLRIRCNSIQPAAILTPMWEAVLGDGPDREARARAFVRETPLQRFGTPEEVAHLVVHLASDESAYTTGAEFTIDGGLLAGTFNLPDVDPASDY
jgi:NAD(P)-dependent dehydrogenase (short-subunit alcohol dehydrogenase family)